MSTTGSGKAATTIYQALIEAELTALIGAGPYERTVTATTDRPAPGPDRAPSAADPEAVTPRPARWSASSDPPDQPATATRRGRGHPAVCGHHQPRANGSLQAESAFPCGGCGASASPESHTRKALSRIYTPTPHQEHEELGLSPILFYQRHSHSLADRFPSPSI